MITNQRTERTISLSYPVKKTDKIIASKSSLLPLTRAPKDYGRVAVLYGGTSAEREVSLRSGEAIYIALIASGIDAIKIDTAQGIHQLLDAKNISRVFVALLGRDGEDGVIQGFLKALGIPFTGSCVSSAAFSMDKLFSKRIFQQAKIPTAPFHAIKKGELFLENNAKSLFKKLGKTLFVKPVKEGSSVGMSKVNSNKALIDAIKLAHQYDEYALIESYISGKEYTVSIIKGVALDSIRIQTQKDFYDYEAKYQSTATEYFCPSGLSDKDENELGKLALDTFDLLGCSGWGRVDFIQEENSGNFFVLEVNTVPGMTETSLVPKAARALGINFQDLVIHILDTSFVKE